ncbi:N-acetylmuramoyl-L-alanine amidase [Bradyrhizobium sp. SRL28]|uniref:N-acetylmuramoyl-L-alanine amidase n=1 Tax=Bradyrhizobium sp. SRL28 TaxID=2836178 RepID=UPI001BDE6D74|nr:N-acetylmuramoyl-L-alanine amidase [Bradyrhizobium sp. SRL28]MBT1509389.1 N-acetylmuramoyl-L-alanine amidase [Bradyrhizobium sp. SRL28]
MTRLRGKVSWFGGPNDTGVSPDEGLAFIYDVDDAPHLFLDEQPPGTTGLARRLAADSAFYIACRWNYDVTSKTELLQTLARVRAIKTGRQALAYPADWGPHQDTDRLADISPALMTALGIETDDEVEVTFPVQQGVPAMPYESIVISSGHGKYVRGATGIIDEVDEARRVVERVAEMLEARGVDVDVFHDDTSQTQSENLDRIVSYHNSRERQLDVSVHFNAYVETTKPMGCEVLFVSQSALAGELSSAIAEAGDLIDRGAKKRTDLAFLNGTDMPSVLIETAFVDSTADADAYQSCFDEICESIATVLGGKGEMVTEPPPGEVTEPPPVKPPPTIRIDVEVIGDITIIVNGVPVS